MVQNQLIILLFPELHHLVCRTPSCSFSLPAVTQCLRTRTHQYSIWSIPGIKSITGKCRLSLYEHFLGNQISLMPAHFRICTDIPQYYTSAYIQQHSARCHLLHHVISFVPHPLCTMYSMCIINAHSSFWRHCFCRQVQGNTSMPWFCGFSLVHMNIAAPVANC